MANRALDLVLIISASLALTSCGDLGIVGEAKDAVRRDMLDPDAAQFRDIRVCSGDNKVVTGEANGKNSFGAYAGFKAFFYSEYRVAYAGDDEFMEMMNRCYKDLPSDLQSGEGPVPVATPESPTADKSAAVKKVASIATAGPMDEVVEGEEPSGTATTAQQCWADYCPCDKSDPDYGYMDVSICRDLQMGRPVGDDVFSIGAKSRDARRALREFDEQNP